VIIFEYINKFMYFIVSDAEGGWLYCSGVSMSQFLPITKGRHGLASNPAMRGLQLGDLHLRRQMHEMGAKTDNIKGNPCDRIVPKDGDWYRQLLSVENASKELVREVIAEAPEQLVANVFHACLVRDFELAKGPVSAEEMEAFLSTVCEAYGKQAGWPTTASAKGFRK